MTPQIALLNRLKDNEGTQETKIRFLMDKLNDEKFMEDMSFEDIENCLRQVLKWLKK